MSIARSYERHGLRNHPLYFIWVQLRARCNNSKHHAYPNYGGRGIKVCTAWDESFSTFLNDMDERPTALHSIDRVDNDLNYSCGRCPNCKANNWDMNCRWATSVEQNNNQRRKRAVLTHSTLTGYTYFHCRCEICRAGISSYQRGRRGQKRIIKP